MRQEAPDAIGNEVGAQRSRDADAAEYPAMIGAPVNKFRVGDGVGESERLVDPEGDVRRGRAESAGHLRDTLIFWKSPYTGGFYARNVGDDAFWKSPYLDASPRNSKHKFRETGGTLAHQFNKLSTCPILRE